jgi:poly(beta-D-mannuronate) C5 epimerase
MPRTARGMRRAVVAGATGALALAGLSAPIAGAAACTGQVRYAASSNTIYLTTGDVDLPALRQLCPAAPLVVDDATRGIWQLRANLVVQNGATLRVRGPAAGGSVATLRLMSRPDGTRPGVVEITAEHGTLEFRSTAVTSWDETANGGAGGPDLDPAVPATAGPGGKGRAFVRAVSYLEGGLPDGAERESRMDIVDSDLGYLGWFAGEAYGVAYKARGCGATTPAVCARLDVLGTQVGSRFHHNYMGTYTWGALGMTFEGNEYDHNVMYGLDPHDDSDDLTITANHAHHNGSHGIICSQRCDGLLIQGNEVDHNGVPPYVAPGEDPASVQVHGIMLHRGVTDTVVERNDVHDHPAGAGIAVFDSMRDVVRDNQLRGNRFGLRISVGSHEISYQRNTVTDSGQHAVYSYRGVSDDAEYGRADSRPADTVFEGNTFDGAGSSVVRLGNSDRFRFSGNTILRGAAEAVRADLSRDLLWEGVKLPAAGIVLRSGSTATVRPPLGALDVSLDGDSSLDVVAPDGQLSEVAPIVPGAGASAVTPGGSTLRLAGSPQVTRVRVTPRNLRLVPSSGGLVARPAWAAPAVARVLLSGGTVGATTQYRLGNLTPGAAYVVRVDGVPVATKVAAPGGTIAWAHTEPNGAAHEVTVGPAA